MKILMISTPVMPTPPAGYGGIERVVHVLSEELIRGGHEVTLVAVRGSRSSGRVVEVDPDDRGVERTHVGHAGWWNEEPIYRAARVLLESERFDVVHDWSFQNLVPLRHPRIPVLISICFPPPEDYERPNLVACSRAHAELCGGATRFVHYGLPLEDWPFREEKRAPLIHIAKIAPYKGQHLALRAARRAGCELRLAGGVESRLYYWTRVLPALWAPGSRARAVGEIRGTREQLSSARGLVQTPLWFDAFPLVVLEALACGTPVLAFARGGLAEQIEHGVTGFLCEDVAELSEAMRRVDEIKPVDCRAVAQQRFTSRRMTSDYLGLYERICDGESW